MCTIHVPSGKTLLPIEHSLLGNFKIYSWICWILPVITKLKLKVQDLDYIGNVRGRLLYPLKFHTIANNLTIVWCENHKQFSHFYLLRSRKQTFCGILNLQTKDTVVQWGITTRSLPNSDRTCYRISNWKRCRSIGK